MTKKVSELSGALLDYWVGKAENINTNSLRIEDPKNNPHCVWRIRNGEWKPWQPSKKWQQGGPIIERERINPSFYDGTPGLDDWSADIGNPAGKRSYGPTPLIAAMRAFVASKFGDEVSDELART